MTFVDLTKSYSLVNTRKGSLCMTKCQPYNGYYWCYYDYVIYEEYSNLFILYLQNSLKTHLYFFSALILISGNIVLQTKRLLLMAKNVSTIVEVMDIRIPGVRLVMVGIIVP
jgi:hypothetical protein